MNIEPIANIEEALDQLQHTRKCETEYLYERKKCNCALQDIRDALLKYRHNVWEENREF
jgi:hypothetical protein